MSEQANKAFFNSEAAKNRNTWKQADGNAERVIRVKNVPNPRHNYATGLFQDVVHYQRPNMFPYLTATAEVTSDTAIRTPVIAEVVNTPRVATAAVETVKDPEPAPIPVTTTTATKTPITTTVPRFTSPIVEREVIVAEPLPQVTTVMPTASRVVASSDVLGNNSFVNTNTIQKKGKSYLWILVLAGSVFGAYKILK